MLNYQKYIGFSRSDVRLYGAPICDSWILDGNPVARNAQLFKSHDGTAYTLIWDCTAGTFNWFYDQDETFQVLEGNAVLTTGTETREIGPGSVVFFPSGSRATWRIDKYIRKVAFVRQSIPKPVGLALRIWRRASRTGNELRRLMILGRAGRASGANPALCFIAAVAEALSWASAAGIAEA
jgi:uncharacterized cupin superfamily protein